MDKLEVTSSLFAIDEGQLEYQMVQHSPQFHQNHRLIILLHEGLGSVSMWKEFPLQLANQTNCDVLSYSRLGYGNSSPCKLPRPISYMHDEALQVLPQVLKQIHHQKMVLLGHSDGGSIAAIYAGAQSDPRLQGLILIAPHFFVESMGLSSIIAAKTLYDQGDLKSRLQRYHGNNIDCAFRGWNDAWLNPDFYSWDITEYLPSINVPTLLIQGQQDQYGSAAQLNALQDAVAKDVFVNKQLLAACGHSPHRDQPRLTLQLIDDFLAIVAGWNDSD